MFPMERTSWLRNRCWLKFVAGLAVGAVAWCCSPGCRAETPPKPVLRIPLSELGFPGYPVSLLHAGASMATLHMLDSSHVLFTYSLRSLVPRLPGDDVNDTDRQVAAVLVEIPSGKVLARTKWHLHDHGRYLWQVGNGVFVMRSGSELSLVAPLQGLASGEDPFRRFALPHRPGLPVAVEGSPDGRVLTVHLESTRQAESEADDNGESHKHKHYVVEFFRLTPGKSVRDPIQISGAGAVGSPVLLRLPMDGDGYLWAEDGERGKWTVSFNEFGGKQEKLTPVMSSCHPRLSLLSRSQFLAETCRGSDDEPMLAAYGFDGHENWQEQFGQALQPPTIAVAPVAGRFAMSRLVASSSGAPVSGLVNDDPLSQEIRVYQTESGDLLLRVQCAPAVRSAENFDLSPEGSTLAVLAPETLDLYRLPGLSARDRKDLAEVQAMTPPEGTGPVALTRLTRPAVAASQEVGGAEGVATPSPTTANAVSAGAVSTPPAPETPAGEGRAAGRSLPAEGQRTAVAAGDDASARRKPPTLLNPGENAEYKGQAKAPE